MQFQKLIIPIVFLSLGFLTACGGEAPTASDSETTTATSSEDIPVDDPGAAVEKAMSDAMKQLNGNGETKEVVDFRKLKALMPKKIAGMERVAHTGEKVGAMGFKMSTAQAEYEGEDKSLDISVVDFAGVAMVLSGAAAWASVEIDKETDTGYERTTQIDGYKAFESYDSERMEGQVSVIAEDRFIVTIEGRNIKEKDLKAALKAVDVKSLKKLQ